MMKLEISVIILLAFILLYLGLINLFIVLFRLSGISKDKSKFQVFSMITRIGFTSLNNEEVFKDKSKRRLGIAYMVIGNICSIITIALIVNVLISIGQEHSDDTLKICVIAFIVFVIAIIICNLPFVKGPLDLAVEKRCNKIPSSDVEENILTLLESYDKNAIMEVYINSVPKILANRSLSESGINVKHNVRIMMVKRKNSFLEATKDTVIQKGDLLVVFGTQDNIRNVFIRTEKDVSAVLHSLLSFKMENIVTLIDNYGPDAMAEVKINNIPELLKDKVLEADMLKKKYDLIILSIKRKEELVEKFNEAILELGDTVVVFGSYVNIKRIFLNME